MCTRPLFSRVTSAVITRHNSNTGFCATRTLHRFENQDTLAVPTLLITADRRLLTHGLEETLRKSLFTEPSGFRFLPFSSSRGERWLFTHLQLLCFLTSVLLWCFQNAHTDALLLERRGATDAGITLTLLLGQIMQTQIRSAAANEQELAFAHAN